MMTRWSPSWSASSSLSESTESRHDLRVAAASVRCAVGKSIGVGDPYCSSMIPFAASVDRTSSASRQLVFSDGSDRSPVVDGAFTASAPGRAGRVLPGVLQDPLFRKGSCSASNVLSGTCRGAASEAHLGNIPAGLVGEPAVWSGYGDPGLDVAEVPRAARRHSQW